jgi:tRNA (uracil-5-)-methyltransferase TRM9
LSRNVVFLPWQYFFEDPRGKGDCGGPPAGAAPVADVAVADGFALPFRKGSCDAVLCIAVLHHVSSSARRLRLLLQLLRVLRPGAD